MGEIEEGLIERQEQDQKFKDKLKIAENAGDKNQIEKIEQEKTDKSQKKKTESLAKQKELIGEDLVEKVKNEKAANSTVELQIFDEFFTDEAWWKEIQKFTDKVKGQVDKSTLKSEESAFR